MKKRRTKGRSITEIALGAFFVVAAVTVYYNHKALEKVDHEPTAQEAEAYAAALTAATAQTGNRPYHVASSTPQYVVLSFDGSKDIGMLNETLDFERAMAAQGESVRFTYFINAAYFLTEDTAKVYQGPGQKPGVTAIGYSNSAADVAQRVKAFNAAYGMGNEIGSHTVGHFDGTRWSYADWKQEFTSFAALMQSVPQNNPSVPVEAPLFLNAITGFRAPNLGVNGNLYKVEKDFNFTYDASGVAQGGVWPYKLAGIWHIPLGSIYAGTSQAPVVAMDYNLRERQTAGQDRAIKGTPQWTGYYNETVKAYEDYFTATYATTRAPIVIGQHFSKWNDGVYWEALKTFAKDECGKPLVKCVTFNELVSYLNANGLPARLP